MTMKSRGKSARRDCVEVTRDDMEIVSALRAALADRVGKQRFELWFGAGARFELKDGALVVGAPNWFFRDWLVSSFRRDLEAACLAVLGKCLTVDFRVEASLPEPNRGPRAQQPAGEAPPTAPAANACGEPAPAGKPAEPASSSRAANGSSRRRPWDFGSFVVGRSNRLARAAAEMVVERPGELSPLVIHGPTSVGKTHLLEAICQAARKARPGITAIYLTAEQFTTAFLQALRGSGLPSFRQRHRGVDLLAIDDLQFFSGKRCTQLEVQHTIDTFLRERRQIVFAADRAPAELADLEPELRTRLQGGMVCSIEHPDYEMRLGILAQMARRLDVRLPHDVQAFVASRLTSHARELSGAVCRLRATSQALARPIDLDMAEETLSDLIRHSSRLIRLPDVAKAVCDAFGLEPRSLQSSRKAKSVSHPRMLAMWLARKYTRAALSEIGDYFGRRSHSTVISAQRRVENWLASGLPVELADSVCNIDQAIRQVEQRLLAG